MSSKFVLVICAIALFVQVISASCINNAPLNSCGSSWTGINIGNGLAGCAGNSWNGMNLGGWAGNNLGYGNLAASSGGAFPISSASPIAPSGVSVLSENVIEGPLAVTGKLPFLAAVALESQVPTSGSATAQYGCGNGNVGITSEGLSATNAGYAGSALDFSSALGYGTSLGYGPSLRYATSLRGNCGTQWTGPIALGNTCGCNAY